MRTLIFNKTQTFYPFSHNATASLSVSATIQPDSGTLTSDETNVSALESVSIGDYDGNMTVYKFVVALSDPAEPYEVLIGDTAADTLDNLKAAVNATGLAGVTWSEGTVEHPDVVATTNTDTTQVFEAKIAGKVGTIEVTETSAHLAWGATVLSGATNRMAIGSGTTAIISNTGEKTAYVRFGSSTGAAQATDYPVMALSQSVIYRDPALTHVSATTEGNDTTTLLVSVGEGQPVFVAL